MTRKEREALQKLMEVVGLPDWGEVQKVYRRTDGQWFVQMQDGGVYAIQLTEVAVC